MIEMMNNQLKKKEKQQVKQGCQPSTTLICMDNGDMTHNT